MIAGVFALIVVPLLAAGVLSVVRRFHTLTALLAAGVAGALGTAVLWLPLDRAVELGGRQVALGVPMELLGRQLVLGGADRIALGGIFIVAAGLFLIAWGARLGLLLCVGTGAPGYALGRTRCPAFSVWLTLADAFGSADGHLGAGWRARSYTGRAAVPRHGDLCTSGVLDRSVAHGPVCAQP